MRATSLMATPISTMSLLRFLLFASLLFSERGFAFEGTLSSERHYLHPTHHKVHVNSLMPSRVCSPSPKGHDMKRASLEVVHKHGPCSPLRQEKTTYPPPWVAEILAQDESYVAAIQSRLAKKPVGGPRNLEGNKVTIPTKAQNRHGLGNYLVTVGLGSPKKDLTLILDTATDISWTQCQPCLGHCFGQQDPLFEPHASLSYANISCDSPSCKKLASDTGHVFGCLDSNCLYGVRYAESIFSDGFYARDKLTLTPNDVIDNFLFGCGQENYGGFGGAAGLLSLGRNSQSLISQTAQKFGKVFSYCLPSPSGTTGYLTLGSGGEGDSSKQVKYTPSPVNPDHPTFYFVNMEGISVAGQRLAIPTSVFSKVGTIIASEAVVSWLPRTAYSALQKAFTEQMTKYKRVDGGSILDTCYDFSPYKYVMVPQVVLHFSGDVEMDLYGLGIIYFVNQTQVCLAFAGTKDDSSVGVLGSVQQRTFHVVYDDAQGRVGFAPKGCQ